MGRYLRALTGASETQQPTCDRLTEPTKGASVSNVSGRPRGIAESSAPGTAGDAYRDRIVGARHWDDLRAVVTDAEVAYAEGTVTGCQVETLAEQCNEAARELPLQADPCPECGGRGWWLSCWDGNIRCSTCEPPLEGQQAWPPHSTDVVS
jgi:hypothetical protein